MAPVCTSARNIAGSFPPHRAFGQRRLFYCCCLRKFCGEGTIGESSERLAHLLQVMVDEIRYADALSSQLILPDDRRVRQIAQKILADRAYTLSQAELAKQAGLSVRTLSRLFIQQTGLTFGQWKQKAKVILSLEYLLRGEPVSLVAQLAGYENVSAFIAVFRRFMGMTPGAVLSAFRSWYECGLKKGRINRVTYATRHTESDIPACIIESYDLFFVFSRMTPSRKIILFSSRLI
ncbi:HTH-type transcriptional repressor of iron proteins A [Citrobacter koseri]|uniref:HTH-type transcriptional repressor of iron proteins A n=1 Tax=Citrobacter koseri TaxID=545 RepID=A0A2X2X6W9_CITKO|nr:HTH-type transcriptional repressor of iron proteins A [Citrobacter koseri]